MELKTLRQNAVQLLAVQLASLADEVSPADYWVDDALREIMGHPLRPRLRKPYLGMFREAQTKFLRRQAVDCITGRLMYLDNRAFASDNQLDNLLRKLLKLDARTTQKVYEGIPLKRACPTITEQHLLAIAPYADPYQISRLLPHINAALVEFEINTRLRQAHFLAQLAHESGSFYYVEEQGRQAGSEYEWREDLGNMYAGDGVKFKGRGLIQITGRDNYEKAGAALGVNLITFPRRLADDDLAARSAGWFWSHEQLNDLADEDDVERITRVINGGYNGLDSRKEFLARAKKAFELR